MAPQPGSDFGLVGLGVMGSNLALNVADHGFRVALWDRRPEHGHEFVRRHGAARLEFHEQLPAFVAALRPPRRILIMITAGPAVDEVLEALAPLCARGDVLIDGGNTWHEDTLRREQRLRARGLSFFGMGVSGGEEGARRGPALMPGGDPEGYRNLAPVLEAIAARTGDGPCVTHVGPGGAGHYVKMVHNGIEYADMQGIAEAYDLLHRGLGLDNQRLEATFAAWNQGPLESFLIEITAKIFAAREPDGGALIDRVLDKAGQKGTGKWTVQAALDLGVAIPSIAAALDARVLSSQHALRQRFAAAQPASAPRPLAVSAQDVHDALLLFKAAAYAQGFELLARASAEYRWNLQLHELARIWKGGCIIRARFLDEIRRAFLEQPNLEHLALAPNFRQLLRAHLGTLGRVVAAAAQSGIPVPAFAASHQTLLALQSPRLPQNLVQAQRDAFGAHTFQRLGAPDGPFEHFDWLGSGAGA
jgi:6-phosphogluconate dehydrogenase